VKKILLNYSCAFWRTNSILNFCIQ
jgi:hypothetical protein